MIHYGTIREVHREMVGGYVSKKFHHHVFSFGWDPDLARKMISISPRRAEKRIKSYVNYDELDRVYPRAEAKKDFSIRFGVKKTGTGNFGKRKDFCLLGASYSKEVLTLYYRKLELFGGLVYDQAIILEVVEKLRIKVKKIAVMCGSCHSFALKRNSNEKLFKKLEKIYGSY